VEEPPRSGCICADPEDLERYRTKTGDSPSKPRCPSLTYNRPNLYPFRPSPHPAFTHTPQLSGSILDMSTQTLQSLYSQIRASPSASHVGLCVFVSLDGQQFHSYPPSIFGLSPNTFESVLPNLRPRLAVQASSPGIQAAIREA